MSNNKPKPKIDYGAFVKNELSAGKSLGDPWIQQVFDRCYKMMESDPAYTDGQTHDYNGMEDDALALIPMTNRTARSYAGIVLIHHEEADPVWQAQVGQEEQASEQAELNQSDTSELEDIAKEQAAKTPGSNPKAIVNAAVAQTKAAGQFKRVQLSSGKWVSIPK